MANELVANLLFDPQSSDKNGQFSDAVYDSNLRQLVSYVRGVKGSDFMSPVNGSSLLEVSRERPLHLIPERSLIRA